MARTSRSGISTTGQGALPRIRAAVSSSLVRPAGPVPDTPSRNSPFRDSSCDRPKPSEFSRVIATAGRAPTHPHTTDPQYRNILLILMTEPPLRRLLTQRVARRAVFQKPVQLHPGTESVVETRHRQVRLEGPVRRVDLVERDRRLDRHLRTETTIVMRIKRVAKVHTHGDWLLGTSLVRGVVRQFETFIGWYFVQTSRLEPHGMQCAR